MVGGLAKLKAEGAIAEAAVEEGKVRGAGVGTLSDLDNNDDLAKKFGMPPFSAASAFSFGGLDVPAAPSGGASAKDWKGPEGFSREKILVSVFSLREFCASDLGAS